MMLLAAAAALAQTPQYRVVTPEGKAPALQPGAGVPIDATLPATAEARADHRECMRTNAAALSLLNASREVVRTRENLRSDRAQGRSLAYSEGELERNWKYYKSQGGVATTPDEVKVPDDPCKASADKFRQQAEAAQTQYRECAATHEREIRISRLASEVIQARQWLAAAEKVQEEKRRNPSFGTDTRGSGEWASLAKLEPATMRQELAQRFTAYRSAGGPATRIDEVSALPDPCVAQRTPAPSPIRREGIVIPARK